MYELKLSPRTKSILSNFHRINPGMVFRKGNYLSTTNEGDDFFAVAKITETIPQEFAIADLSVFLSIVDQYEDHVLIFGDKNKLTIASQTRGHRFDYTLAEPRMIKKVLNEGPIPFPEDSMYFALQREDLKSIKKIMSVADLSHVAFVGDGKCVKAMAFNKADVTSNTSITDVGETKDKFEIWFAREKIEIPLDGSYEIAIGEAGQFFVTRWRSPDVDYYMSSEIVMR